jgi:acyl-coenzyme A thioesterase PaaI-like protein
MVVGATTNRGLHIRTHWDGEYGTARYNPRPEHTAYPGVVYGGLLASLIDCHSIGTAIAAMYESEGRKLGEGEEIRCVTGKLSVSYRKPTPLGVELVLRSHVEHLSHRKATVITELYADGEVTVTGETIAIRARMRDIRDVLEKKK